MNFRSLLWVRLRKGMMILLGLAFLFSLVQSVLPPTDRLEPGTALGEYSLRYVTGGAGDVTLSSFEGKGVLLVFWATWCGACVEEIPLLEKIHEQYAGEHFAVLGISGEAPGRVRAYAAQRAMTYPLLRDVGGKLEQRLAVRSIPFAVFLGPDGRVVGDVTGVLTEAQAFERVEEVLGLAQAFDS